MATKKKPTDYIDMDNKDVNFDEIPEEEIESLAEEIDEAMTNLKEWEENTRKGDYDA